MKATAIDFDGCICTNAFPNIGAPNRSVIDKAIAEQAAGAGLILWTCREGELLQQALDACAQWGLHFDAVELTKELSKNMRGFKNTTNISEEMADVEIMLEQLRIIYGNRSEVDTIKAEKLLRLSERLEVLCR